MAPNIFTRLIDYISTPREVEATPENLAKWEKRAPGWVMHCNKCSSGRTLREIRHPLQIIRQEEELRPLPPVPQMVLACH